MQFAKILAIILVGSLAFGCAYPRERFIRDRFRAALPVIPGGEVEGEFSSGAYVPALDTANAGNWVRSNTGLELAKAWYLKILANGNWKVDEYRMTEEDRKVFYCRIFASRHLWYGQERAEVNIESDGHIHASMRAVYVWDMPTVCVNSAIMYPALALMRDGAMIFYPILRHF